MNKVGVYRITNLINDKVYIGSSINLKSRKYNHFKDLGKNKHCNVYLQNAYNKYGGDNFKWEVIEHIPNCNDKLELKNKVVEREQYWIDEYRKKEKLYNLRSSADSCYGSTASEHTETLQGILTCQEDWKPYYEMYMNEGKTFRSLEKLLGVCHKSIKRQLLYYNFIVVENGVYTSHGWLNRENIDTWKIYHDMYINEGKSLRDLEKLLNLDKTHIKDIFMRFGFVIKTKKESFGWGENLIKNPDTKSLYLRYNK